VFVPIYDYNPLRHIPFQIVTVALIVINCAVFALQAGVMHPHMVATLGIIPVELFHVGIVGGSAHGPRDMVAVPEAFTLVSYMFLHGDVLHLFSNMIFLWVFGDNVEDALGHARFLVFYLLCGTAGALAHSLVMPGSDVPLIGASAGVAGIIAAYLMLHPKVQVWVLALRFIPLKINAAWALGAWVAMQFVMLLVPDVGPVAWWAHIGGLVAGAVLVVWMRRPGIALFDRSL
jgi:membrane associated rhomboid family serine protease